MLPDSGPALPIVLPQTLFELAARTYNTLLHQLPGREEVAINSACSFEGDVRYYNRTVPPQAVALAGPPPGVWNGRVQQDPEPGDFQEALQFPDFSRATVPPSTTGYTVPQPGVSLVRVLHPQPLMVIARELELADGDFFIPEDTTNVLPAPLPIDQRIKAGISLKNARLYVKGDLILDAFRNDEGQLHVPGITGENSTLIVEGNLLLRDGTLDAGEQGMVIHCKNLFLGAHGDFRGLFLMQGSAIIRPQNSAGQPLRLRGALVCASGRLEVTREPLPGDLEVSGETVDCIDMASTELTYDARYARSMQKYGNWQLISLRRL